MVECLLGVGLSKHYVPLVPARFLFGSDGHQPTVHVSLRLGGTNNPNILSTNDSILEHRGFHKALSTYIPQFGTIATLRDIMDTLAVASEKQNFESRTINGV